MHKNNNSKKNPTKKPSTTVASKLLSCGKLYLLYFSEVCLPNQKGYASFLTVVIYNYILDSLY